MEASTQEIIQALKHCASKTRISTEVCMECRYSSVEDWGGGTCIVCDTDQIALDAADRLEELSNDKNRT